MNAQLPLEEKHVLLKSELCRNLNKKQELESKINKQFEELKKLEISLERRSSITAEV
jgi:SUMO ligase MMS21 Smc5/6 complex component